MSERFNTNDVAFLGNSAVTIISNLFLCCFFGKLTSESYACIADYLFDLNWHGMPLDLQKYFIMMIANAQIPLNYRGYGTLEMNLQTFTKVRKIFLTIILIDRHLFRYFYYDFI